MITSRLVLLVVAGLLCPALVKADTPAPAPASTPAPYTPDKAFSAEQVITTKGLTLAGKVNMDEGKTRSEMSMAGMNIIQIVRPDLKKSFSVMPAQKMVMVMPLDDKMMAQIKAAMGDDGKFETVGTEAIDGVPCTKFKMTTSDAKIYFWWVNMTAHAPVKLTSDDGSFTAQWKNYKAGPQDPALFEPPKDYQMMDMSSMGGAGGGGAPAGQ